MSAKIGEGRFWVENVEHYYFAGCQSITAILNPRKLNLYREQILAQAEFYNLTSSSDRYSLYDFQLDDRLREIFGKSSHR